MFSCNFVPRGFRTFSAYAVHSLRAHYGFLPIADSRIFFMTSFLVFRPSSRNFICFVEQKKTMKVQLASDLHLEMNNTCENFPHIKPLAPFLVLAGDIGVAFKDPFYQYYCQFLEDQSKQFERVFVLAGNHEYYGGEYNEIKNKLQHACNVPNGNVMFMDRSHYVYENPEDPHEQKVRFVGCTLWSHVPDSNRTTVQTMLNDYRRITVKDSPTEEPRKITVDDTNAWHAEDVKYITEQIDIAEANGELVCVLTHHAPTFTRTAHPRHEQSPIKTAFATNLEHLMKSHVKLWAFGHTHFSTDYHLGDTRIVSNQLGYLKVGEQVEYSPTWVIDTTAKPSSLNKRNCTQM